MNWYIIGAVIFVAVASIILNKPNKKKSSSKGNSNELKGKFRLEENLFTPHEKQAFLQIKQITDRLGYLLFAKVNMEDIVTARPNAPYGTRSIVSQMHVDFLICNRNSKPICIIELDDSSHDKQQAQKNDNKKNVIFADVGIKLIRCRSVTATEIEKQLNLIHA